jgi:hypothetical protein
VKRFLAILLLLIYTTSVFGVTVHVHYCMKKYAGISFLQNKNQACQKCGMKNSKNGCCKDEQKKILLKTDHQQGAGMSSRLINYSTQDISLVQSPDILLNRNSLFTALSHAPPLLQSKRLNILHCIFLI